MKYWLLKSHPETYSWKNLLDDQRTRWDGIRNHQAKNYLLQMNERDLCFFYHSSHEKQIVGLAQVFREAYPDPTSPGEPWVAVDIVAVGALKIPVSLSAIKSEPHLAGMALLRQSRLSVLPVSANEYEYLCALGGGISSKKNPA